MSNEEKIIYIIIYWIVLFLINMLVVKADDIKTKMYSMIFIICWLIQRDLTFLINKVGFFIPHKDAKQYNHKKSKVTKILSGFLYVQPLLTFAIAFKLHKCIQKFLLSNMYSCDELQFKVDINDILRDIDPSSTEDTIRNMCRTYYQFSIALGHTTIKTIENSLYNMQSLCHHFVKKICFKHENTNYNHVYKICLSELCYFILDSQKNSFSWVILSPDDPDIFGLYKTIENIENPTLYKLKHGGFPYTTFYKKLKNIDEVENLIKNGP